MPFEPAVIHRAGCRADLAVTVLNNVYMSQYYSCVVTLSHSHIAELYLAAHSLLIPSLHALQHAGQQPPVSWGSVATSPQIHMHKSISAASACILPDLVHLNSHWTKKFTAL